MEIKNGEYVYTYTTMPERKPMRTTVSIYKTEELALLAWLMGIGRDYGEVKKRRFGIWSTGLLVKVIME